jgi:acyltransferase family protein
MNNVYLKKEKNNVTILRIFLAIVVIYFHSGGYDLFYKISRKQISTGQVAVYMFFIISGFFISRSFLRNDNKLKYISSRFLRIFPGLVVCHWFCALVIGTLATNLPIKKYFSDPGFVKFIFKNSYNFFDRVPTLPGVFTQGGRLGTDVDGSLWTITYEIYYYIVIFILGYLKLLNKKKFIVFFWIITVFLSYFSKYNPLFMTLCCFLSGTISYLYFEKINFRNDYVFLIIISVFLISCFIGKHFNLLFSILGVYIVLYLSFRKKVLSKLDKIGDLSYGLYIYAFPIQQLILSKMPDIKPMSLFFMSFVPTLILSILSWNYVEKPFLTKK